MVNSQWSSSDWQLGHHPDTSMRFEHYRALITQEDADAYWLITPAAAPAVIQLAGERAGSPLKTG
jgi:hypothetical protein